jgi:uncharacterized membrane protein HdeD (DUF308 family)
MLKKFVNRPVYGLVNVVVGFIAGAVMQGNPESAWVVVPWLLAAGLIFLTVIAYGKKWFNIQNK